MTQLDAPLRAVAKRVVNALGMDVTVVNVTHGTYSVTNAASTETTAATSLRGVLSEYEARELSDTVKVGDRKLVIAGSTLAFTPDTADRVIIGSTTYRIISARGHYSGAQVALWELQLRGNA